MPNVPDPKNKGHFMSKKTPEVKFYIHRWLRERRSTSWCLGRLQMRFGVSPITAVNWLKAAQAQLAKGKNET